MSDGDTGVILPSYATNSERPIGDRMEPAARTYAQQGVPLPILYGTGKVNLALIEKFAPAAGRYPDWMAGYSYNMYDRVCNDYNVYECYVGGESSHLVNATAWLPNTGYIISNIRYSYGRNYVCIGTNPPPAGGNSGTTPPYGGPVAYDGNLRWLLLPDINGPHGTGSQITDGNVMWKWIQREPMRIFTQTFLAAIAEGPCETIKALYWDKEKLSTVDGSTEETLTVPTVIPPATPGLTVAEAGTCIRDISVFDITAGVYLTRVETPYVTAGQYYVGYSTHEGSYYFNGSYGFDYAQGGHSVRITYLALSKVVCPRSIQTFLGLDRGQSLNAAFDACGYQHTAMLSAILGGETALQQETPNMAVEAVGPRFGLSTDDASPADIINDMLTDARRGCSWLAARVDASLTATTAASYRTYCDAAGLRISLLMDQQRTALEWINDILALTNTDVVWSGGKLKFVPCSDTAIASPAYGTVSYTPSNAAIYNLGIDDFLDKDEPVQALRRSQADVFNEFPIQYVDRAQDYAQVTVSDVDMASVDLLGMRKTAAVLSVPCILPSGVAVVAASRRFAQHSILVRNKYTFRVGYRYMLLEPTDIVTLTDPLTGLSLWPVRIISIDEDEEYNITIVAEDYPAGTYAAAGYAPQVGDGYRPQESGSLRDHPTGIDGVMLGIGSGVIQPTAINPNQESDQLVPNPNFLINTSDVYGPDGWVPATLAGWPPTENQGLWNVILSRDAAVHNSGDSSIQFASPDGVTVGGLIMQQYIPVVEGELYEAFLVCKSEANSYAQLLVGRYNSAKAAISASSVVTSNASAWTSLRVPLARMPANTRWIRLFAAGYSTTTGNKVWLDCVQLRRSLSYFSATMSGAQSIGLGSTVGLNNLVDATTCPDFFGSQSPDKFIVHALDNDRVFRFQFNASLVSLGASKTCSCSIYKNGAAIATSPTSAGTGTAGAETFCSVQWEGKLAAADYIQFYITNNDTSNRNTGASLIASGGRVK